MGDNRILYRLLPWRAASRREGHTVRRNSLDAEQEHAEVLQGIDYMGLFRVGWPVGWPFRMLLMQNLMILIPTLTILMPNHMIMMPNPEILMPNHTILIPNPLILMRNHVILIDTTSYDLSLIHI